MHITIKAHQTQLTRELTLKMERRLHFALGRFGNSINRVSVRLTDINGPKGGPDKQCLIVVKLRKGGEIVVQGRGVENGLALNHCADRISRAVEREVSRRWRAPIRRMRRGQNVESFTALESEEKISNKIEQDSIVMSLPGCQALTTGSTGQKVIGTACKKNSKGDTVL